MLRLMPLLVLMAACASTRPAAYSESCRDPGRMCALSYDFEPSGGAVDPFVAADAGPAFLVANEDALVFSWTLARGQEWDHAVVFFARSLTDVLTKVESAASGTCDGQPVFLAASNFMPGRNGRAPERERVVAVVGALDAPARVLEATSRAMGEIARREQAPAAKLEGLALSADCRTLLVGVRSVGLFGQEAIRTTVYPVALDIDWTGTREEASLGEPVVLPLSATCSGEAEGISSLTLLPDGAWAVTSSFEEELSGKQVPTDVPRGRLAGSLWRRSVDGEVTRLACFPGHKPEVVLPMPDGKAVRVIAEDDEYDGRPIRAFAVGVELK